jgi:hypothetical protein
VVPPDTSEYFPLLNCAAAPHPALSWVADAAADEFHDEAAELAWREEEEDEDNEDAAAEEAEAADAEEEEAADAESLLPLPPPPPQALMTLVATTRNTSALNLIDIIFMTFTYPALTAVQLHRYRIW